MTTHTPGPWHIATEPDSGNYAITVKSPGISSHVANIFAGRLCEEHGGSAYANARLIAAAPDLLAALEALRGDLLRYPNDDARREMIVDAADAAIAAARGGA